MEREVAELVEALATAEEDSCRQIARELAGMDRSKNVPLSVLASLAKHREPRVREIMSGFLMQESDCVDGISWQVAVSGESSKPSELQSERALGLHRDPIGLC